MNYTYEVDVIGTGQGGPVMGRTHEHALKRSLQLWRLSDCRVRVANITVPPGHDDGGERTYRVAARREEPVWWVTHDPRGSGA